MSDQFSLVSWLSRLYQRGETDRCIEAVQDQYAQHRVETFSRAKLYMDTYQRATGHPLILP